LRVPIRTKARHFSCGARSANTVVARTLSTSIAACPFGHWMRRPGPHGRWPVRESSPPGGGGEFEACTPRHPSSERVRRPSDSSDSVLPGPAQAWIPARAVGWTDRKLCDQSPIAGAPRRTPEVTSCMRGTHPRRRAERTLTLATFHARKDATSSVRRDTPRWAWTGFVPPAG
jgi:hypothetical protein